MNAGRFLATINGILRGNRRLELVNPVKEMPIHLALKVDVDTDRGTREGVPALV